MSQCRTNTTNWLKLNEAVRLTAIPVHLCHHELVNGSPPLSSSSLPHLSLLNLEAFEHLRKQAGKPSSIPTAMQPFLFVALAGFTAVYGLLRLILYLTQDKREPPAILTGVPFFGPLVGMIWGDRISMLA